MDARVEKVKTLNGVRIIDQFAVKVINVHTFVIYHHNNFIIIS
jgi:hypothetical protein